ncbi:MAG TPA: aldolase/citrate lyase family protein [Capsulimonadaceae bacterium]|jgi:hypothetical protein
MNRTEKRMVDHLLDMADKYNVVGVKAEFEAEGTRLEEAMRLKEVSEKAGLGLTLKVGGCEAIKDMFEASSLGVRYLVAPMVETAYALKKYLAAVKFAFSDEQQADMDFLINLETKTACDNFDEMLSLADIGLLSGVVLGRVDLSGSLGLSREAINTPQILEICLAMSAKAKERGLDVVIGGGVSADSIPFFNAFPPGHLDRFETRKVVFGCPGAIANPKTAYLKAVEFELMWLRNKREYYGAIFREDDARMALMETRYKASIEALSNS